MAASEKDIQDVIKTLIAEGIGEGEEGMRRIAETIINRAEQRGISPAEVVRQRAQYTGYSNPGPAAVRAQSDPSALSAAQAAWQLAQGPEDPTGGANHYFNPSIVRPSWAQSMTPTGTFGGHSFYTDRPVPPRNIPPTVANMSPSAAAIRQMTSPSGGNTKLQSALNQVATRERNRVTPQIPPARSIQTVATIPSTRSQFGDDPGTPASGPVVARIPSRTAFNGDPGTPASGPVIATYPTTAPATRTVPTMRVGNSANNITQARNEQAVQRQVVPPAIRPVASPAPPIRTSADIASLYAQGGPTRLPAPVIPDRLTPSASGLPANYGTMTPTQVAQIGLPSLAPPQIPLPRNQVATQLAVTPPVSVPLPRPRPYSQPVAQTPVRRPATPFGMPNALPQRIAAPQPLRVVVQRDAPAPSLYYSNPLQFGQNSVSQSGDTSVGSQLDAAAARASGDGGRIRRY